MTNRLSIQRGPRLAERTSIGLGGCALAEVLVRDVVALDGLAEVLDGLGGEAVVLGAGSNIMAADYDLPLVLLRRDGSDAPQVLSEDGEFVFVRADGAYPLPALLGKLAGMGASGLEGLAGIPGSVGGAIAMNAGSFGSTMGDALDSVTVYSRDRGLLELSRDVLELDYRHMDVKDEQGLFFVTGTTLKLRKAEPDAIRAVMKENIAKKKASQPVTARSAGCVYKNPSPDMPAGRLLDEAGMKGRMIGGMAFSTLHANFMVNLGGGTFAAASELMHEAEEAVKRQFGISLEREVLLWV